MDLSSTWEGYKRSINVIAVVINTARKDLDIKIEQEETSCYVPCGPLPSLHDENHTWANELIIENPDNNGKRKCVEDHDYKGQQEHQDDEEVTSSTNRNAFSGVTLPTITPALEPILAGRKKLLQ